MNKFAGINFRGLNDRHYKVLKINFRVTVFPSVLSTEVIAKNSTQGKIDMFTIF